MVLNYCSTKPLRINEFTVNVTNDNNYVVGQYFDTKDFIVLSIS